MSFLTRNLEFLLGYELFMRSIIPVSHNYFLFAFWWIWFVRIDTLRNQCSNFINKSITIVVIQLINLPFHFWTIDFFEQFFLFEILDDVGVAFTVRIIIFVPKYIMRFIISLVSEFRETLCAQTENVMPFANYFNAIA